MHTTPDAFATSTAAYRRATLTPIFRASKARRQSHVALSGFEPLTPSMRTLGGVSPVIRGRCGKSATDGGPTAAAEQADL